MGLFRLDLWEPYGLLLVRLQLRWMAFLSILGKVLSFSVSLTFPFFHCYLLFINLFYKPFLLSSETLIPHWVGWGCSSYRSRSDKRLHSTIDGIRILTRLYSHWMLGLMSYTSLEAFPSARKPCVWFLFASCANEPCLFQCGDSGAWGQQRSTGLGEGHSQHSCVCLKQRGGLQLGIYGMGYDSMRTEGGGNAGIKGVEETD